MAIHRHSAVSLSRPKLALGGSLSTKRDPDTVARFKKALDEAKSRAFKGAPTQTERDRFGLRTTRFKGRNTTLSNQEGLDAEVDKLQKLYDIVLKNENTDMSNPPRNRQYRLRQSTNGETQELFLGGFFKGVGKFAKKALPLVSLIPGVGTAVGLAATVAGQLLSSGGKKGTTPDQQEALDTVSKDPLAEARKLAETSGTSGEISMGADFRKGGALPSGDRLKDLVRGGKAKSIGKNAVEVTGPSHAAGGVPVPGIDAEVEGGETVARLDLNVNKRGKATSKGVPFVFSKALNVPGSNVSFADAHKKAVKSGISEDGVRALAEQQEGISGVLRGSEPSEELFLGGLLKTIGPFIPGIVNTFTGATAKVESAKYTPVDRGSLDVARAGISDLQGQRDRIARERDEVSFDPSSAINENRRLGRSIMADKGASEAVKAATIAGTQRTSANIIAENRNAETAANVGIRENRRRNVLGLTGQIASAEQGLSDRIAGFNRDDAQGRVAADERRIAAKAQKGNIFRTGLSQIGDVLAGQAADRAGALSDDKMLDFMRIGRFGSKSAGGGFNSTQSLFDANKAVRNFGPKKSAFQFGIGGQKLTK